jgi:quercetin dioxygenase-like cupin family protein
MIDKGNFRITKAFSILAKIFTIAVIAMLIACTANVQTEQNTQQKEQATELENLFLSKFLTGIVFSANEEKMIEDLSWNPHPSCKGVYLKHLIVGKDTDNKLSCHIEKFESGCVLDTHFHDGKIEIHEVIAGSGKMYLDGKEIDYSPGKICIIPANTPHKIVAGKDGLYMLAKFTPSLL